jgi:hypothetical protein
VRDIEFALLETPGPQPAALMLSTSSLITLLILATFLARAQHPTRQTAREIGTRIISREQLQFQPSLPSLKFHVRTTRHFEPAAMATQHSLRLPPTSAKQHPPSGPIQSNVHSLGRDSVSPAIPNPHDGVSPHVPTAANSLAASLMPLPLPAGRAHPSSGTREPTRDVFGTVPLPVLISRETALAASLAALPAREIHSLPHLSIRVNAAWLEALPKTQEKLYFSCTRPQADTTVLAYLPRSRTFAREQALTPLWEIRDVSRVPPLAALRSQVARHLGVRDNLVGLYTWHPPVFENALRMFILERMDQLGISLGPHDGVTVSVASGPNGYVLNLEPIRAWGRAE